MGAAALAVRLPALALRPMHGDEANQAVKAGDLLEEGRYRYDPLEHHGPTLYYFALIPAWLSGKARFEETTEATYRIVPVFFGVVLVALLLFLRDALGGRAVLAAAVLTAASPAFVFYSRYFIQEILLVCFTFGAIVSGWRYVCRPSFGWALMTGAFLGLMHATKETCVVAYASMAGALALTVLTIHGRRGFAGVLRGRVEGRHLALGALLAAVVSVLFFSSFFTHLRGPLDSFLAFGHYFARAGGAGLHDKPWYYYVETLLLVHRRPGPWWSEAFVLALALIGAVAVFSGKTREEGDGGFLRFLVLYTFLMTVFYSAIPYKTPWTLLSFYHGIVLLAGVGAALLLRRAATRAGRTVVVLFLAAGAAHLGFQAYQANYSYPADPRNPYVYAHTSTAFLRLVERMEDLAETSPLGTSLGVMVIQPDRDYWPLPWYLRKFEKVGYWDKPPEDLDAPVIIASPELRARLEERLRGEYTAEMHGLRPGVLRVVYIRKDLWEAFLATRT